MADNEGLECAPPHLKTLAGMEKTAIPGLVEVLREEGIDGVRYTLWDGGHLSTLERPEEATAALREWLEG